MKRPRILLITSNPPADEMGGSMLLYRQFVERSDYEIFVVTDKPGFHSDDFPYLRYEHPQLLHRLQNSRLSLYAHDYVHTLASCRIPNKVMDAAKRFRPDLVLMGAETWISDLAIRVARRLKKPLAGYFMDWPTYGMLGHSLVKQYCASRFMKRYQACDLAFGICPEMLEALGPHKNSHVYYPPGARRRVSSPTPISRNPNAPFRLLFAGNLGQWYGKMLLSLSQRMEQQQGVSLRIAGKNDPWSNEDKQHLEDSGVFAGFLKGRGYQKELENADALLVIMGFEPESKTIESTSFKSKLADYLVLGKPILVWGPDYSTAARTGNREGFAVVVDSKNPKEVNNALRKLSNDPARGAELVSNGIRFYEQHLAPDIVFGEALNAINTVIEEHQNKCGLVASCES